jgi:cyclic-di-GMP phosphodiesterase TipF (flagellum assembly factor)
LARGLESLMRLGAIFIVLCIALIAGSAGVVAHIAFSFTVPEAVTLAITVLTALALYNMVSARLAARPAVGSQLTELGRGTADVARQVGELGRRLAALESKVDSSLHKPRATTADPLALEFDELGTLVKQLADTVSAHATTLADLRQSIARPAGGAELAAGASTADPVRPPEAEPKPIPGQAKGSPHGEMLTLIRTAIAANHVDLYLQPIVTLPQRKVRYYEALARLRNDRGEVLPAVDFIAQAESAGLMPQIDNLMIFRCVQVVRRLLTKNREIGLFCNLSGSTLTDAGVFAQLLEFLDANRAIAPSIVLEFTHSAIRAAGPIEYEGLSALADRGFRFSLDNLSDLRIEPRALAAQGFRFIKVPAKLLLDRDGGTATDIHPADLANLLARFGIELIAEKIETEGTVVELLDYDVKFGQGFLFSLPRPVRAEALQSAADRGDVVARESATPEGGAAAVLPARDASTGSATDKSPRASGRAQLARGRI